MEQNRDPPEITSTIHILTQYGIGRRLTTICFVYAGICGWMDAVDTGSCQILLKMLSTVATFCMYVLVLRVWGRTVGWGPGRIYVRITYLLHTFYMATTVGKQQRNTNINLIQSENSRKTPWHMTCLITRSECYKLVCFHRSPTNVTAKSSYRLETFFRPSTLHWLRISLR